MAAPLMLFDCIDQPVLVLGEAHAIKYANPAAALALAMTNGSLDQTDVNRFVRAEDLQVAMSELSTMGAATLYLQPPGDSSPFEVSLTDHRSTSGVAGVVVTFRTIGHSIHRGVAVGSEPTLVTDSAVIVRRAETGATDCMHLGARPANLRPSDARLEVGDRADLQGQLRSMLAGRGPDVAFQPVVDLRSGRTIAVEALARWHSPTHGPIGPDRFVAMAERAGLIGQLDRHVMRTACRAIVGRRDPSSGWPLDLTVNASTLTLCRAGAADQILEILAEEGLAAHRLILEVTESIAIDDDGLVHRQLERLRGQGVRIAVDDFGTGQSSLAQLETLPVDIVKIDRSFVVGVPGSKRRVRYLETILAMANTLGLEVIIEGIEEQAQVHALAGLGIELGQGYLLAEPTDDGALESSMIRAQQVVLDCAGAGSHWQPVLIWCDGAA